MNVHFLRNDELALRMEERAIQRQATIAYLGELIERERQALDWATTAEAWLDGSAMIKRLEAVRRKVEDT
jgi:hypothetical protein